VTNPGYASPPPGSATPYYYTARDAFRLEGQKRTDLAANYVYGIELGGRRVELFLSAQLLNLFNQFQLCGCGAATVFENGGGSQLNRIDRTVRNQVTNPTVYQRFNPFTETPVEGVHYDFGPNFGGALNRFAYTTPRTFRMSFGVRF
jgi:hypothetical protein